MLNLLPSYLTGSKFDVDSDKVQDVFPNKISYLMDSKI